MFTSGIFWKVKKIDMFVFINMSPKTHQALFFIKDSGDIA
jgi:hypothetical protein